MFADTNFKLVVLNELLETGSFVEELRCITAKPEYSEAYSGFSEHYGYDKPIPEVRVFLPDVELTADDLASVESVTLEGGNEAYHLILPFWDGEDDRIDVTSVDRFEVLPNLREVVFISMAEPSVLDPVRTAGITVGPL